MTAEAPPVVGREAELRAVVRFVARERAGTCVLVLQGEAGIGKTTLWAAGVDAAHEHGLCVLVTRREWEGALPDREYRPVCAGA